MVTASHCVVDRNDKPNDANKFTVVLGKTFSLLESIYALMIQGCPYASSKISEKADHNFKPIVCVFVCHPHHICLFVSLFF